MELDAHFFLSVAHLLLIAPLLLFVGFQRSATPDWLFQSILIIGFIVLGFHSFRFLTRFYSNVSYAWVNLIHILLFAPLLLYIGWHKKDTPRLYYELLLMLSFGMVGYHMFSLVRILQSHPDMGGQSSPTPRRRDL